MCLKLKTIEDMASVGKKSKVEESGKSVAAAVTKVTDMERVLEKVAILCMYNFFRINAKHC